MKGAGLRLLWPLVAGIPAHELAADRRVEALPEAGEVGGRLDSSLVRGEQVDDEGRLVGADAGGVLHAEEVLQAGGYPRGAAVFVVDFCLATRLEADADRCQFVEEACVGLLLEEGQEILACCSEFVEALQAEAEVAEGLQDVGRVEPGEGHTFKEVIECVFFDELLDTYFEGFAGEEFGGFGLGGVAA